MSAPVRHVYKYLPSQGGMLYAWFTAMHTRVDILLCADASEEQLASVAHDIEDALRRLEAIGNCYDDKSRLAFLNRTCATAPQPVGDELYRILHLCLEGYERTGGCFDVTVHTDRHTPDTIRDVCLSPTERTLFFSRPGIFINLSGFLKGYALDHIRSILHDRHIVHALINMGNSSVLALGSHPLADGWKVGFGSAARAGNAQPPEVWLHDECLTTSGNDSPDRRHIIHPQTGQLITGQREVAVVTASCADGEMLSTALFVANAEQRKQLCATFRPRLILDL